jgi:hypothetical protein
MEDIASKFFNTLTDCPSEIPNCEQLREEYVISLDAMKVRGACSACAERSLRNNFLSRLKTILQK